MLDRLALLAATQRRSQDIAIPDDFYITALAGQALRCWSMTARQQCEFEASLVNTETGATNHDRLTEIKARKIIATVGDAAGQPLFTLDDLEAVQQLPASLADEIVRVSNLLNTFAPTAEVLRKNLPPTPTANSPTRSRSNSVTPTPTPCSTK